MFNFETTWRKNQRLEGEILSYQNQAKRDAFKIMQLQNVIKNLEIELTKAKAKNYELENNNIIHKDIVSRIKLPTKSKTKTTKGNTK